VNAKRERLDAFPTFKTVARRQIAAGLINRYGEQGLCIALKQMGY
jgi:hypothetical protein